MKIFSSLSILAIAVLLAIPSCSSKESKTAGTQEKGSLSPALTDDVSKGAGLPVPASPDEGTRQGVSVPSPQNPQNSPPSLTNAYFKMETRDDKDILTVVAEATDKDGDEVAFTYEWTKNGESAGSGDFITGFKRGDKISVKITPFDGKEYGRSRILNTEINNTPPKITAHKDYKFDGVTYSYQVRAYDPDGDALTYELKTGPPGMTISSTGLITWTVPSGFSGKAPASVSVSDGKGGEAFYNFEVIIKAGGG